MTANFNEKVEIIVDGRQILGHASRMLYGTIVEPIGTCIYGGLWAEMLTNRKFWAQPSEVDQAIVEGWVLKSNGNRDMARLDDAEPYSPPYCICLTPFQDQLGQPALCQSDLMVGKDRGYRGYFYARSGGGDNRLQVTLTHQGNPLFHKDFEGLSPSWQRQEFEFSSSQELVVDFIVEASGNGPVWVDSFSLMPMDNLEGVRKDVLETVRTLKPALIRFPGGCFADTYHWRLGVGDRDRRPAFRNEAYGTVEPNDFGTGEFLAFCQAVGAEPYINANFGSGSPQEAAEWVSYCNSPASSLLGSLRAKHGHAEPFNVLHWGVGNEIYGPWEVGHSDAASYARRFCEFNREMKAADPRIKLVAVGCDPHPMYDRLWNIVLLKHAAACIDYLSIHKYVPGSGNKILARYNPDILYKAIVAAPLEIERLLRATVDLVDLLAPEGSHIKVVLDEWNVWLHFNLEEGIDERHELRDALYAAGLFNALMRLGSRVGFAIQSLLVNVLGAIKVDALSCSLTPVGRAFELYARHSGELVLATKVRSPSFEVPHTDELPWMHDVPFLDACASVDTAGRKLLLAVVNRHPAEPLSSDVQISGLSFSPRVRIWELNAPEVDSIGEQIGIGEQSLSMGTGRFNYTFPAHSATIMELDLV